MRFKPPATQMQQGERIVKMQPELPTMFYSRSGALDGIN